MNRLEAMYKRMKRREIARNKEKFVKLVENKTISKATAKLWRSIGRKCEIIAHLTEK